MIASAALQLIPRFWSVTWQAFVLVSVAELFDKTFFVVLILALRYDKLIVFIAGFLALLTHVFLAAGLGYIIASAAQKYVIDFATAGIYLLFAFLYGHDYLQADSEKTGEFEGLNEASESLGQYGTVNEDGGNDGTGGQARQGGNRQVMNLTSLMLVTYTTTFIAEMGDRTQFAMIGLHASQPLWPVVVGCTFAFLQLTGIAVLTGKMLEKSGISERTVLLTGAISFFGFAIYTSYEGYFEYRLVKAAGGTSFLQRSSSEPMTWLGA
jgi:putative Ca2+/H+ antiporter (TMEM165/GDT1 family)